MTLRELSASYSFNKRSCLNNISYFKNKTQFKNFTINDYSKNTFLHDFMLTDEQYELFQLNHNYKMSYSDFIIIGLVENALKLKQSITEIEVSMNSTYLFFRPYSIPTYGIIYIKVPDINMHNISMSRIKTTLLTYSNNIDARWKNMKEISIIIKNKASSLY